MDLLPQLLTPLLIIGVIAFLFARRNSERAGNTPLRSVIEAQVCFETTFDRASITATGRFAGTLSGWIPLRGTKRLVVGTDTFMVSAPLALREYVFTGPEASIGVSQAPSRWVDREWIVIIGQAGGREVQLAISPYNLPDAWQALAGTGAELLSDGPSASQPTTRWGRPARSGRYSLQGLAAALVFVLIADVAAWLGGIALPLLGGVASFGFLVAMVMFVVWFYRARVNAEGHGWPQRHARVWTIAAWFIPLINLWLPFRIMTDIWRAGLPPEARANRAILPGIWWTCCLTYALLSVAAGSNQAWYVVIPIEITAGLSAIMTALLVHRVSSGPLGQAIGPI